ncbi:LysR substrate-binding domain-containing protein [Ectopseudomonas mendocina]|uniref:LysR substrate-binding domain-containing protein n=1 Tax=Ectopseudomonas mendocina TaxID=300 RepID=A0ABZ2RLY8_ECTME
MLTLNTLIIIRTLTLAYFVHTAPTKSLLLMSCNRQIIGRVNPRRKMVFCDAPILKTECAKMEWTRRLRVQHLELLLRLADTGSISETARLSFTAQPSLSKWLKELEDAVGAQLYERHSRGLKPTEHGRMLLIHAERVIGEMKRAQEALKAISHGNSFRISIGTSPASATHLVPDSINHFLKRHPKASIELNEAPMHVLLERLEQGEHDLVIGRLDNYKPRPSLHNEMLCSEGVRVICRPEHPLLQRKVLNWDVLNEYEWIVWPQGTPIRSRLDSAITAAGSQPLNYRIESSSLMANLWMLQTTDLLSVASERVTQQFSQKGLIVDTGFELEARGSLGMCWRNESKPHFSLTDLKECFRQNAAKWGGTLKA